MAVEHPAEPPERADWDVSQVGRWSEKAIAPFAGAQRTLVTHAQLVGLGFGRGAIEHALAAGRLYPRHRGVYSLVPQDALPPLAAEQAAVLACGENAYLSHHSAAAVWGVRPRPAGAVAVTVVARDAGRRRAGIHVHRSRHIDPRDIRIHERIPITAPARTLLDIAPELDTRELERAFDEALALRLISLGGVRAMLERYPQRAGSAPLRGLLDPGRATTATRSSGEELMLALTRRGGLDPPEVNVRVGRWTVDFLWRRERVIVEVDGFDFHRGRWAFERDRRKDGELHAAGFLVIRVTMLQLRHEPEVVLVRIASALARRAPAA